MPTRIAHRFRVSAGQLALTLVALVGSLSGVRPPLLGQERPAATDPPAAPASAAEPADPAKAVAESPPDPGTEGDLAAEGDAAAEGETPGTVRFAFEGTPWRDVIKWLADESGLALHVGELPTGSFSYTDTKAFTYQEAIDRVNLFLLPEGFTLVRSGRLLSVVNLGDPRSQQQLDALAELVPLEDLDRRENHEVVKCFFPLGEFDTDDAVQELSGLNLMSEPVIFEKTNRLLITDTVSRLKAVKTILDAFQPSTLEEGTVMQNFALQHVNAEDILVVARPHLGLATGEMIGIDVSLSADLQGKNIFVTGAEDKVALIEGLITALDKPEQRLSTSDGQSELRTHFVEGGNAETVYSVLQTLLAGKSIRLSMDETAGSIVALAPPEVQAEIAETVAQLQASEAEFAVIQLKTVDPYFAVSLLEEMLGLDELETQTSDSRDWWSRRGDWRDRDRDRGAEQEVPKIDADPENMRLFVRAKPPLMEQIKQIVAELDAGGGGGDADDTFRLFPLTGTAAERALEIAARFWREDNPVILFPSPAPAEAKGTERVVVDDSPEAAEPRSPEPRSVEVDGLPPTARYLTDNLLSQAPPIRCQVTTRGVWMQCSDTEALDRFYEQLRTVAGPASSPPSPPVVFYLKYAKPDDALRMLAELLDGGEAARDVGSGSLVNGYVSSGSGSSLLSSLVISRDGTTTMIAGTITVVADPRLNRLIAQGTESDIELIEGYLKIIDKDTSLTAVEVYGSSHVIELRHTRASEVAAVIREAYAGRVAAAPPGGGRPSGQPDQPRPPQQRDRDDERERDRERGSDDERGPGRSQGPQRSPRPEPTMTIAVHEPSNSLIVTAPEALFREVEKLAQEIDARNAQAVQVLVPTNAAAIRAMLEQGFLGGERSLGGAARPAPQRPPSPSPLRPGR